MRIAQHGRIPTRSVNAVCGLLDNTQAGQSRFKARKRFEEVASVVQDDYAIPFIELTEEMRDETLYSLTLMGSIWQL
jgi:hypothetical protein